MMRREGAKGGEGKGESERVLRVEGLGLNSLGGGLRTKHWAVGCWDQAPKAGLGLGGGRLWGQALPSTCETKYRWWGRQI